MYDIVYNRPQIDPDSLLIVPLPYCEGCDSHNHDAADPCPSDPRQEEWLDDTPLDDEDAAWLALS